MQGFNMGRYVPPDQEGVISGNRLNNKHPLGARARKLTAGILTVRFEMPFAVWCGTCPQPTLIAQGVRFNAAKQKVGNYYSTPIWSFKIRHADCKGHLEIRTDPKNTDYVVVEGGTRRDTGEDTNPLPQPDRDTLRKSAFAHLEKTIEDRAALAAAADRIKELESSSFRAWDDPYTRNQALRRTFREERKELERATATDENLKDRMSLGIDLAPATEADALRASLVDFRPAANDSASRSAAALPLFTNSRTATKGRSTRSRLKISDPSNALRTEIASNARLARDPFLIGPEPSSKARIVGVRRKQLQDSSAPEHRDEAQLEVAPDPISEDLIEGKGGGNGLLVSYDSE